MMFSIIGCILATWGLISIGTLIWHGCNAKDVLEFPDGPKAKDAPCEEVTVDKSERIVGRE